MGLFLVQSALYCRNGGSAATTINITGMGGNGSGGGHFGILTNSVLVNLNNTNNGSSLNFINCVGVMGVVKPRNPL